MRKIEEKMCSAIAQRIEWKEGNTEVCFNRGYNEIMLEVRLHGNVIAFETTKGWYITDAGWGTVTTRSRLNAILTELNPRGRVFQKDFTLYYDNGTTTQYMSASMPV